MFSLDSVLDDLWPQARPAPWQKSLLKRLFYEDEFQQFAAAHRHLKGLDMVEQVLEHLDILCTVSARDLEQIPEHGPLVIIANHPTGTLDGLALMYAVSRVRRDVKVVTHRMLTHLEPLSSLFIPVDNMGGRTAKTSLVQMEQHLQNAGVLIFFPEKFPVRREKASAIKSGTLALSNSPASCVRRCCRCIFRRITACSFMPARWCRRRCPCCC